SSSSRPSGKERHCHTASPCERSVQDTSGSYWNTTSRGPSKTAAATTAARAQSSVPVQYHSNNGCHGEERSDEAISYGWLNDRECHAPFGRLQGHGTAYLKRIGSR